MISSFECQLNTTKHQTHTHTHMTFIFMINLPNLCVYHFSGYICTSACIYICFSIFPSNASFLLSVRRFPLAPLTHWHKFNPFDFISICFVFVSFSVVTYFFLLSLRHVYYVDVGVGAVVIRIFAFDVRHDENDIYS